MIRKGNDIQNNLPIIPGVGIGLLKSVLYWDKSINHSPDIHVKMTMINVFMDGGKWLVCMGHLDREQ